MTDWNDRHPDPFGVKARDVQAIIDAGHPPVANNVVLVDFDGTLFPFGGLNDEDARPLAGAAAAVRELRNRGYYIVIFTSRMSPRWWMSEAGEEYLDFGVAQRDYVRRMLDKHDIPHDEITAEKVPAEAYFDDKAWRVNAYMTLRECVIAFLASQGKISGPEDVQW